MVILCDISGTLVAAYGEDEYNSKLKVFPDLRKDFAYFKVDNYKGGELISLSGDVLITYNDDVDIIAFARYSVFYDPLP